jgi:hypothetical protein
VKPARAALHDGHWPHILAKQQGRSRRTVVRERDAHTAIVDERDTGKLLAGQGQCPVSAGPLNCAEVASVSIERDAGAVSPAP